MTIQKLFLFVYEITEGFEVVGELMGTWGGAGSEMFI